MILQKYFQLGDNVLIASYIHISCELSYVTLNFLSVISTPIKTSFWIRNEPVPTSCLPSEQIYYISVVP
jgi:hypothetical protein